MVNTTLQIQKYDKQHHQYTVLVISWQNSQQVTLSLDLPACFTINFSISSSSFSLRIFPTYLISAAVINPLPFLSYFLKMWFTCRSRSLSLGWEVIAAINSLNEIPPVYSRSYSAMISQAEFLEVSQPFQLSKAIRSVGRSTPDLVVSKQSKIYLRSQTSCSDMFLVTKCLGSYQRRSFRLKRVQQMLERPIMTSSLPWLLQADLPGLQFFFGLERLYLLSLKELVAILLEVFLIIKIYYKLIVF